LRVQYEIPLYHIISRGNKRKLIFREEVDRVKFINLLDITIKLFHLLCHAYCVMENRVCELRPQEQEPFTPPPLTPIPG